MRMRTRSYGQLTGFGGFLISVFGAHDPLALPNNEQKRDYYTITSHSYQLVFGDRMLHTFLIIGG